MHTKMHRDLSQPLNNTRKNVFCKAFFACFFSFFDRFLSLKGRCPAEVSIAAGFIQKNQTPGDLRVRSRT